MKPITICYVYFRCMNLVNFEAGLFCVRQQDLSQVEEIVVLDNNTVDSEESIQAIIEELDFPVPVFLLSCKHGDPLKTHTWSQNVVIRRAHTSWVFMARADYLMSFDILAKFVDVMQQHPDDWNGFVTSNGCHMQIDMSTINDHLPWRSGRGPSSTFLNGIFYDYTCIDTGIWLARTDAFERVGGFDERFTEWGHSQTHYQWKLHLDGVECHRVQETLFFHPIHPYTGLEKDVDAAHQKVAELGLSLPVMWARFERKQY